MNPSHKKLIQFAAAYILVFGSYLFFHIIWKFNENYGFISASLLTLLYIVIGLPFYFGLRKKTEFVAKGILWGVITVVIFLFSFGGCGVLR